METNSFVNVRKNCTQKSLELPYKIMLINKYLNNDPIWT